MSKYATLDDVRGLLPNRVIDATSKPTEVEVQANLDSSEAMIEGELEASGVAIVFPITPARGVSILGDAVKHRVAAIVERAYASTGNDAIELDIDEFFHFNDLITEIRRDAERIKIRLGLDSGGESRFRSNVTDSDVGESVEAGDFDPKWNRGKGHEFDN